MTRLLVPALALLSAAAFGQATPPTASLKFDKATAVPGSVVKATLMLTFAEGLHGYQNPPAEDYQIPVKVTVEGKTFTLVKAKYPKGSDFTMAGEAKPSKVYEGTIAIPLELKAGKMPGTYDVSVKVDYQQCNESSCFPPSSLTTKAKITVAKPGKKG